MLRSFKKWMKLFLHQFFSPDMRNVKFSVIPNNPETTREIRCAGFAQWFWGDCARYAQVQGK